MINSVSHVYIKGMLHVPSELQENLIRSHAAGVGAPLTPEQTRRLLTLRLNVLAKGCRYMCSLRDGEGSLHHDSCLFFPQWNKSGDCSEARRCFKWYVSYM